MAVVLYLIGIGLKKAGAVPDKYIPLILGGIGIVLCAVWVLATSPLKGVQDISMAVFTAVIQGMDPCGGTEHLCESDRQAGWKSRIKNICLRRSAHHPPSLREIWCSDRNSRGVRAVYFLNCLEKEKLSGYPVRAAISWIDRVSSRRNSFAVFSRFWIR